MRHLFLLCFIICCTVIKAQSLSNETTSALNHIFCGYIEHGIQELVRSSNSNDLSAQFYLAICYEYGIGMQKSEADAFTLYRRTAERGLPDAMYKLATYYKEGIIVTQSDSKSTEWLKRFERRGGKNVLPDLLQIYNEGLKNSSNYSLNPTSVMQEQDLAVNNNVNIGNSVNSNNTTINITYANPHTEQSTPASAESKKETKQSDVDINIPQEAAKNEYTFAVIIANENYRREEKVPFANNDGESFKSYCTKVLGLPEKNVKYIADASLNDLKYNLNWLKQVMEAYNGEARAIFYYAGHGIPDEAEKTAYLLPVDGYGSDVSTGYKVDELYATLGQLPSKSVTVFLDACFSGTKREGGMLASARGVAIKAKKANPKGKMVVFSAAQGDETAYPYNEQCHGMFTYFLLKKLQETKGNVTLGELGNYITTEVKKQSIVVNGKMQTPTVIPSAQTGEDWKQWKLK